jgi:uncharacterized OB-fold protein
MSEHLESSFTGAEYQRHLNAHRLMGSQCRACGQRYLPPRPLCPACHRAEMAWVAFAGRGRLVAFTAIHIAPTAMLAAGYSRENPYCTGIVQLEEGPSISAQILGVDASRPEEILIGTPLQVTFVEREGVQEGETQTGLAFRP